MALRYLPIKFCCQTEYPIKQDNNLIFILRSVLGFHLRKMCCICNTRTCTECSFNQTCTYAVFFESIADKSNAIVPGRTTLSHPFTFTDYSSNADKNNILTSFSFTITLFGKAISYLPYIYAAFVQAGENGIFKHRVHFTITQASINQVSVIENVDKIRTDIPPSIYDEHSQDKKTATKCEITLISPLRMQIKGKYSKDFTATDFLLTLLRRYNTIMMLYGNDFTENAITIAENITFSKKNLHRTNQTRYSARQSQVMNFCGVIGSLIMEGTINGDIINLLEFGKIASVGKNTNFGLGQIDYKIIN